MDNASRCCGLSLCEITNPFAEKRGGISVSELKSEDFGPISKEELGKGAAKLGATPKKPKKQRSAPLLPANVVLVVIIQSVLNLIRSAAREGQKLIHRFIEVLKDLRAFFRWRSIEPVLKRE